MATTRYRKHGIKQVGSEFLVYTPEEMQQPAAFRYPDTECDSLAEAKEFIDSAIEDDYETDRAFADLML